MKVILQRLLLLALVGVVTFWDIGVCIRTGRLQMYPIYDDVSYFSDALHWVDVFLAGSVPAVIREYIVAPPRAPVSTMLATASYAFGGITEHAPYYADGLVLLLMLLVLDGFLGHLALWRRALVWVAFLCTPTAYQSIIAFRPDLMCGAATAGGVLLLLRLPLSQLTLWQKRCAGLLFGFALLAKPSVFPLTLLMLALTIALAVFIDDAPGSLRVRLRGILPVLWPTILLTLVYYPVAAGITFGYVSDNIFGKYASIWVLHLTLKETLLYYLTGGGGYLTLGADVWVYLGIVISAWAIALWKGDRGRRRLLLGLGIIFAIAYLQPTVNRAKNEFLASTFDMFLLFGCFVALSHWLGRSARAWQFWIASALLAQIASAGIMTRQHPQDRELMAFERGVIDQVQARLQGQASPRAQRVFVTFASDLNAQLLNLLAHRDQLHYTFAELHRSTDLSEFHSEIDQADMVIASTADNSMPFANIPSTAIQGTVLQLLLADKRFIRIARVEPGFIIFKRHQPNE